MAHARSFIDVRVPFEDGDDANRQNERVARKGDRVNIWGEGGGELEIVIVDMDTGDACYEPREEAQISRSLQAALGQHPAFIRVRRDWPPQLYGLPNSIMDDDDFRQARLHYGATPKHDGGAKDDAWWAHAEGTHNFLVRLQDCHAPDGGELMSMLRGQAEDLGGLFYVPSRPFIVHPDKEVTLGARAAALHNGGKFVPFTLCEETRSAVRQAWFGKRFLASMVEVGQGTGQWVSIVFDRLQQPSVTKTAHLYILDPDMAGRSERADHILHVWRQVLRELKYPANFVGFVFPLTNRPHRWTTGYISLFSCMQAMRGLTGCRTDSMIMVDEIPVRQRYLLGQQPGDPRPTSEELSSPSNRYVLGGNSDLFFRDWCVSISYKTRETDVARSLDWVLHHLVACAAMELGIRKETGFTGTALRRIAFDLEPLADIERWSALKASSNQTIFGGFNPIVPRFALGLRLGATEQNIGRPTLSTWDHRGGERNPLYRQTTSGPA